MRHHGVGQPHSSAGRRRPQGETVDFLLCVAIFLALAFLVVPVAILATAAVLNRRRDSKPSSPDGMSLPTRTV